jgi:drug/metabolite transporter (DMT)-like permease
MKLDAIILMRRISVALLIPGLPLLAVTLFLRRSMPQAQWPVALEWPAAIGVGFTVAGIYTLFLTSLKKLPVSRD